MDGMYILFSYRSVCLRAHRCWGNRRSVAQTGRGLSPSHVPRCQCLTEGIGTTTTRRRRRRDQAIEKKEEMLSLCSLSVRACVCDERERASVVATSLGLVAMGSRERENVWCGSEGKEHTRAADSTPCIKGKALTRISTVTYNTQQNCLSISREP